MTLVEQAVVSKPVRVLIADDDGFVRALASDHLGDKHYRVTEARDGHSAWDLLTREHFELALIDLSMPNIDGFTLIQCIRGHPRTRYLPIIVITSADDRASIDRAFAAGATSFATKPLNWNLFVHQIDYVLKQSEEAFVARSELYRAEAVDRAKEAVVALLANRIRSHTTALIELLAREPPSHVSDRRHAQAGLKRALLGEANSILAACDATLPHIRLVAEQIVIDDQPVLFNSVLGGALKNVLDLARQSGVAIDVAPFSRYLTVRCDPAAMTRVLDSMLRNAIVHSGSPRVRVGLEVEGDGALVVVVEDEGRGADPAVVAACLQPLSAVGSSRDATAGVGLGLTIANAIANAHGGMLQVESRPGVGTRTILTLPSEIVDVRYDLAA